MFNCDSCHKSIGPGLPTHSLVVETRQVSYKNQRFNPETEREETVLSNGTEIVKELKVCYECFANQPLEGRP